MLFNTIYELYNFSHWKCNLKHANSSTTNLFSRIEPNNTNKVIEFHWTYTNTISQRFHWTEPESDRSFRSWDISSVLGRSRRRLPLPAKRSWLIWTWLNAHRQKWQTEWKVNQGQLLKKICQREKSHGTKALSTKSPFDETSTSPFSFFLSVTASLAYFPSSWRRE